MRTCFELAGVFFLLLLFSSNISKAAYVTLVYVFAADSRNWADEKKRYLEENDTLLIYPKVAYRVWCEGKSSGPKIESNYRGTVSFALPATQDMDIVELSTSLYQDLLIRKARREKTFLWCNYYENSEPKKLPVTLKPLVEAESTCNYDSLGAEVVENQDVSFSCISTQGFPRPRHECQVQTQDNEIVKFATATNYTRRLRYPYRTEFTFKALESFIGANITCKTKQELLFNSDVDNHTEGIETILKSGTIELRFAKPSLKNCFYNVNNLDIEIVCKSSQSEEVFPQTEHKCVVLTTANNVLQLPASTTEYETNTTKLSRYKIRNDWQHEGSNITCSLEQGTYFRSSHFFSVPKFVNSSKVCSFASNSFGINITCSSSLAYPVTRIQCVLRSQNTSSVLNPTEKEIINSTIIYEYTLKSNDINRNSVINCTLNQFDIFKSHQTFVIPASIEAKKQCSFNQYDENDAISCRFTAGYPPPKVVCKIHNNSSSEQLNATVERLNLAEGNFQLIYKISQKLKESYKDGQIECIVFQGNVYRERFVHFMQSSNVASEEMNSTVKISIITASVVISLSMLVIILIILLAIIRAFGGIKKHRKLKREQRSYEISLDELDDLIPRRLPTQALFPPEIHVTASDGKLYTGSIFNVDRLVSEVFHQRGFKSKEFSMQDIDQQSLTIGNSTSNYNLSRSYGHTSSHQHKQSYYTL